MNTRSSSPLRHLDLSDETVAKDMVAEKARELRNAYDRIEDLEAALRGPLGLTQLLSHNRDLPESLREHLTTNHRVIDAIEVLR